MQSLASLTTRTKSAPADVLATSLSNAGSQSIGSSKDEQADALKEQQGGSLKTPFARQVSAEKSFAGTSNVHA